MLDELSRGELEGPAMSAGLKSSPLACLQRSLVWAARGEYGPARADVERALGLSRAPAVLGPAGIVLMTIGDHARGMDLIIEATSDVGAVLPDLPLRQCAMASHLGWSLAARDAMLQAVRHAPRDIQMRRQCAEVLLEAHDHAGAAHQYEAAVALAQQKGPDHESEQHELVAALVECLARAGDTQAAAAAARRLATTANAPARIRAARSLFGLGDLQGAAALLDESPEPDARALVARAELHLSAGQNDEANATRARAHALEPELPALARLDASLARVNGDFTTAIAGLEQAIQGPDAEPARWLDLARARLRSGKLGRTHDAINRAVAKTAPSHPVARLLRLRVELEEKENTAPVRVDRLRGLLDLLRQLLSDPELTIEDQIDQQRAAELLDCAIANVSHAGRIVIATIDGVPRTIWRAPDLSAAGAMDVLPSLDFRAGRELIERLVERGEEPEAAWCLRGELELRANELDDAAAAFERALETDAGSARARAGRAAIALARGELETAAQLTAPEHPCPALVAPDLACIHGEALLGLGRLDEARASLNEALSLAPGHLPAWLALTRVELRAGSTERATLIARWLESQAPALFSDARVAAELEHQSQATLTEPALIDAASRSLWASRSASWLGYRDSQGRPRGLPGLPRAQHDEDRFTHDALLFAQDLIRAAAGFTYEFPPMQLEVTPSAAPPMPAIDASDHAHRGTLEVLTPADIDQFIEDGYVRVENCFGREDAAQFIAEANRRISSEPERWVKDYGQPGDERLRDYRAEDPATWVRAQIDLGSARHVDYTRFAPRLWAAICQLLGGPDRIATSAWHDHFCVNLNDRAEDGPEVPALDWRGWHIDDPSRRVRLGEYSNGLLLVMLFSDVDVGGGGTFIVPESVPLVAQALAADPEGVDLVDRAFAQDITRRCTRRVELTGKTGDVFLCHPFMIHTASANASGRIRWMSNPMIRVNEWLSFAPDATGPLAPVELAVSRALQASAGP